MNKPYRSATRLLRAGRPHQGWVNTPVTRASTYVFDSVAAWRDTRAVSYTHLTLPTILLV